MFEKGGPNKTNMEGDWMNLLSLTFRVSQSNFFTACWTSQLTVRGCSFLRTQTLNSSCEKFVSLRSVDRSEGSYDLVLSHILTQNQLVIQQKKVLHKQAVQSQTALLTDQGRLRESNRSSTALWYHDLYMGFGLRSVDDPTDRSLTPLAPELNTHTNTKCLNLRLLSSGSVTEQIRSK